MPETILCTSVNQK